jgi:hypothetical protein
MQANDEAFNLISEVLESVRDLGVKGVTVALQNARSGSLSINDKNVSFTLQMVSNHYKIPVIEMINSNSKTGKRKIALAFSVYYLHNTFLYSLGDLCNIVKRHKSWLSKLNKMIVQEISKNNSIGEAKKKFDSEINIFLNKKS